MPEERSYQKIMRMLLEVEASYSRPHKLDKECDSRMQYDNAIHMFLENIGIACSESYCRMKY